MLHRPVELAWVIGHAENPASIASLKGHDGTVRVGESTARGAQKECSFNADSSGSVPKWRRDPADEQGMTPTRFSLCATCLFLAIVSQTPGEAAADIALWTVVERNDTAPGGGAFLNFGSPVLNGSGQIAFAADVASPGPSGVWRESSGVFEPLLAKGVTPTQPGGETIDWISSVLLTGNGDVVARVELSSFVDGYYFGDGTLVQAIAIEGESAPGTGTVFDGIGQALRVSDAGEIAFFTQLALGGNVNVNNFMGIWAGGAGGLALAARQGDVAPGSAGAEWFILQGGPGRGQPRLAPDGTLAFAATTFDAPACRGTLGRLYGNALDPRARGRSAPDAQYDFAAIASNGTLAFREALAPRRRHFGSRRFSGLLSHGHQGRRSGTGCSRRDPRARRASP